MRIAAFLGAAHGGPAVGIFCNPIVKKKKGIDEVILGGETVGMNCIFVVVGIRNIPEVVQALGEDLTLYCNRIFDIIGEMTYRYEGWLNSYRESKLLLLWKLENETEIDSNLQNMTKDEKIYLCRKKTTLAVVSILKSFISD